MVDSVLGSPGPAGHATPQKPRLRGVLHQFGAAAAAGAGSVLASLTEGRVFVATLVFAASMVLLFAVSAAYHSIVWAPGPRRWMRRADHAMIFVLIAGTYTPVAVLGLAPEAADRLLTIAWACAGTGVAVSLFWVAAPKALMAALALAMGWIAMAYWRQIQAAYGDHTSALLLGGGIAYSVGALAYAFKRPHLWPRVFGYHELFHLLTLVGAGLHFEAVRRVVAAGLLG